MEYEVPMRPPLFTQVTQIGMVVPDLEAAIRHYEEDYGIGPWQRWELDPERASDVQVNGQPAELWRVKVASAMVGQMHWELTEPLDDQSIFGKFLAATGAGSTTSRSPRPTATRRWRCRRDRGASS